MTKRRSPLRVRTKPLLFGLKTTYWSCERTPKAARFEHRKGERGAILHRSTKSPGKWQLTTFDSAGPIGDRQYTTCEEALREVPPSRWRLREVEE